MISASHLTRRFGSRVVVDDISFEVGRGEIVALLEPNGAGKTTTLRMLAGLITPTSGTVAPDAVRLPRATGSAIRRRIGFLAEAPGLWDRLTVHQNLTVYAGLYALDQPARTIESLIDLFELSGHVHTRAAELSKGMRQKLVLVRALLHNPDVLLLDEPTSGLDPEIARSGRRLLDDRRAKGCAILVSTHNLDEAERMADRIAVLQRQLVALDRPGSLRERPTKGRVVVRVTGDATGFLEPARRFDRHATADGQVLRLQMVHADEETPALVHRLVAAGAQILKVRPDLPALEDVYLDLVSDDSRRRATR